MYFISLDEDYIISRGVRSICGACVVCFLFSFDSYLLK